MRTREILRILCLFLSCEALLPATAQPSGADSKIDPKDALGWFERASEQMNLRALGSAPFHMKVRFHALPGVELLPKKKSEIIVGDGEYEETWVSPQQWRREVTLGSYHAVETHSDRARKMEASSDYEPSRVFMLMDALLNPISRGTLSPELHDHRVRWSTDRSTVGGQTFVRFSKSDNISTGVTTGTAYIFLSSGILMQSNENDLVTTWADDTQFAGKVVPRSVTVQAGTKRDLLTAEVEVDEPGAVDPAAFDLPGEDADAGMTLRPLHWYEVRPAELTQSESTRTTAQRGSQSPDPLPGMILHGIVDRHGALREVEVIYGPWKDGSTPPDSAQHLAEDARQYKFRPAVIDGSPCETAFEVL